jgi:hypothetical protein
MSKKQSDNYYTFNVSDIWGKYTIDNNSQMSYSYTYSVSSQPDTIEDYDRWDAEFDAMEDQTSVARGILEGMGVNFK